MGTIKFEIDGETYNFTSKNFWENFVIDNEGEYYFESEGGEDEESF